MFGEAGGTGARARPCPALVARVALFRAPPYPSPPFPTPPQPRAGAFSPFFYTCIFCVCVLRLAPPPYRALESGPGSTVYAACDSTLLPLPCMVPVCAPACRLNCYRPPPVLGKRGMTKAIPCAQRSHFNSWQNRAVFLNLDTSEIVLYVSPDSAITLSAFPFISIAMVDRLKKVRRGGVLGLGGWGSASLRLGKACSVFRCMCVALCALRARVLSTPYPRFTRVPRVSGGYYCRTTAPLPSSSVTLARSACCGSRRKPTVTASAWRHSWWRRTFCSLTRASGVRVR